MQTAILFGKHIRKQCTIELEPKGEFPCISNEFLLSVIFWCSKLGYEAPISDSGFFFNRFFTAPPMNYPQAVGRYFFNCRAACIGILPPLIHDGFLVPSPTRTLSAPFCPFSYSLIPSSPNAYIIALLNSRPFQLAKQEVISSKQSKVVVIDTSRGIWVMTVLSSFGLTLNFQSTLNAWQAGSIQNSSSFSISTSSSPSTVLFAHMTSNGASIQ